MSAVPTRVGTSTQTTTGTSVTCNVPSGTQHGDVLVIVAVGCVNASSGGSGFDVDGLLDGDGDEQQNFGPSWSGDKYVYWQHVVTWEDGYDTSASMTCVPGNPLYLNGIRMTIAMVAYRVPSGDDGEVLWSNGFSDGDTTPSGVGQSQVTTLGVRTCGYVNANVSGLSPSHDMLVNAKYGISHGVTDSFGSVGVGIASADSTEGEAPPSAVWNHAWDGLQSIGGVLSSHTVSLWLSSAVPTPPPPPAVLDGGFELVHEFDGADIAFAPAWPTTCTVRAYEDPAYEFEVEVVEYVAVLFPEQHILGDGDSVAFELEAHSWVSAAFAYLSEGGTYTSYSTNFNVFYAAGDLKYLWYGWGDGWIIEVSFSPKPVTETSPSDVVTPDDYVSVPNVEGEVTSFVYTPPAYPLTSSWASGGVIVDAPNDAEAWDAPYAALHKRGTFFGTPGRPSIVALDSEVAPGVPFMAVKDPYSGDVEFWQAVESGGTEHPGRNQQYNEPFVEDDVVGVGGLMAASGMPVWGQASAAFNFEHDAYTQSMVAMKGTTNVVIATSTGDDYYGIKLLLVSVDPVSGTPSLLDEATVLQPAHFDDLQMSGSSYDMLVVECGGGVVVCFYGESRDPATAGAVAPEVAGFSDTPDISEAVWAVHVPVSGTSFGTVNTPTIIENGYNGDSNQFGYSGGWMTADGGTVRAVINNFQGVEFVKFEASNGSIGNVVKHAGFIQQEYADYHGIANPYPFGFVGGTDFEYGGQDPDVSFIPDTDYVVLAYQVGSTGASQSYPSTDYTYFQIWEFTAAGGVTLIHDRIMGVGRFTCVPIAPYRAMLVHDAEVTDDENDVFLPDIEQNRGLIRGPFMLLEVPSGTIHYLGSRAETYYDAEA